MTDKINSKIVSTNSNREFKPKKESNNSDNNSVFTIAIVDDFSNKTIDVDGDGAKARVVNAEALQNYKTELSNSKCSEEEYNRKTENYKNQLYADWCGKYADISHGEAVEIYAKGSNPNIKIEKYDVGRNNCNGDMAPKKAFDKLSNDVNDGKKIDAVNFSIGTSTSTYQKLCSRTGEWEITPDNVKNHKNSITKEAASPDVKETMEKMTDLTKKDIPVFVASGNNANVYNLYTAADGVTSVGGSYSNGDKIKSFSSNSDVDTYEVGYYEVKKTKDGYDINNDGTTDVKFENTTGKKPSLVDSVLNNDKTIISGTSFASPTAANKYAEKVLKKGK